MRVAPSVRLPLVTLLLLSTLTPAVVVAKEPTDDKILTLVVTPKFIRDFAHPRPSIRAFVDHYADALSFRRWRVVFAVGNSDHILGYPGRHAWDTGVPWARYTEDSRVKRKPGQQLPRVPVSNQPLTYARIARIIRVLREETKRAGLTVTVLDQLDKNGEFTEVPFKLARHPEIFSRDWKTAGLLINARLTEDAEPYAAYPSGIPSGTHSGTFVVKQTAAYVRDLGFDGVFLSNQVATRGHWDPKRAPGYSDGEAREIRRFFSLLRSHLGKKEIVWWDSTNSVSVERARWAVDPRTYLLMDTIAAAGFCVIRSNTSQYITSLESKLALEAKTKVTATLDYVDPYYTYNSWKQYSHCSASLEDIAISHWGQLEGVFTFGNDERGRFISKNVLARFRSKLETPSSVAGAQTKR